MPYDLKTKSGIILRNIPDDMDPNAPELKALVQRQLAARQIQPPGIEVTDKAEAARMATEDMSGPEKLLVNAGAGFDSAIEGGKQLLSKIGIGEGISDEDLKEKRARDSALADTTTGGRLAQIAGEAAPTLVVPFGTFARGAGAAARGVGAVAGRVGAAPVARGAQAVANAVGQGTTRAVVDSALGGAVGGAMGPVTSDESRALNAAVGGTIGAALPVFGRAIGSGYRALTKTGAAQRAAAEARNAMTDAERQAAVRNLQAYNGAPRDIPLTSAAAAESAPLARMETGARSRNGADFYDFDQQQAQAVANKVLRSTDEAGELGSRKASRQAEWNSNWNTAEQVANPQVFAQQMGELAPELEALMRSPEASNPAVRNVLNDIRGEIDRLGPDFTPAHLQQIRANLNARGSFQPQNSYQAAPRDSAAVSKVIDRLDEVLNRTTDDAWDAVKGGYADSSRLVDQAKAAGRVRGSFIDPQSGRVLGTAADPQGAVPLITEAGLNRSIAGAQKPGVGNVMSPRAAQGLAQTLEALRAQNITRRVKASTTGGGGSDTTGNAFAADLMDRAPKSGLIGSAWDFAKGVANSRRDDVMQRALQNPQEMQRLLTMAVNAPGELTTAERQFLQVLRSTMAATGNAAFETQ
jgi:hypothetical protein